MTPPPQESQISNLKSQTGGIDLPKAYEPKDVERRWSEVWLRENLFAPDVASREGQGERPFCMVIPPPNVTGSLHMGHALNNTLQDILARWHRMKGDAVLWLPGTDHAGIATQNVVERELAKEGKKRHHLGREKFVERVWEWKGKYGDVIVNQLKRLGASCDWSRLRFTMDDGLSKAVREVFVRLHKEGLIYRGLYMVNWCPRCQTALSDLEVEQVPTKGHLWEIAYPFSDGSGRLVVATTRPETLLGDSAVAVHPEDSRYAGLAGKTVRIPFVERDVPVIADEGVEREFGTGAVKITPAHDFKDFELGRKHRLAEISVMDVFGKMTPHAGKSYQGLDRFECRKKILVDLKERGLLVSEKPYDLVLGHCYRCRTVVEPRVSLQWFVRTKPLAEEAAKAVREGRTKLVPAHWGNTYFEWLDNIRDWCISRQIWWGHRIPVWYCDSQEGRSAARGQEPGAAPSGVRGQGSGVSEGCPPVASVAEPKVCPTCGGEVLEQDSDVLDTWFSSALWPFSTLGWPEKSADLGKFYPTSVLVTGFDILFFWVARMMMMGLKFMGDVPFRTVYIHALVRDAEGKKMSKSKGNVIDPLEIMDEYGTDALRFTLASMVMLGRDVKLNWDRIEGYKHFINKLWNGARFVLRNAGGTAQGSHHDSDRRPWSGAEGTVAAPPEPAALGPYDRWILSRLQDATARTETALGDYRFSDAADTLYHFVWNDFCDWYLEMVKPILQSEGPAGDGSRKTMVWVLSNILRLLHPFVPFVTEEIWSLGRFSEGRLCLESYPSSDPKWVDAELEAEIDRFQKAVTEERHQRSVHFVPPEKGVAVIFAEENPAFRAQLERHRDTAARFMKADSLSIVAAVPPEWDKGVRTTSGVGTVICIELDGVKERELAELEKKRASVDGELRRVMERLGKEDFVHRAPAEVVDRARKQKEELARLAEDIDKRLAELRT